MSINIDGWVNHPLPYSTKPSLTTVNKFGLRLEDGNPMVNYQLNRNVKNYDVMGNFQAQIAMGINPLEGISVSLQPVNLLPLYWMYGKVSDNTGVKTIEVFDGTTRKPRITISSKTDNTILGLYGVVFQSLNLEWAQNRLKCTLAGKGLDFETITAPTTYEFPKNASSNEISSVFNVIDHFSWNSVNYNILNFSLQSQHANLQGFPDNSKKYAEISEFSGINHVITVQILSDSNTPTFIDDHFNNTERAFEFKIKKADDLTKYLTISGNGRIYNMVPTRIVDGVNVWQLVIVLSDITITGMDDIANSYYNL